MKKLALTLSAVLLLLFIALIWFRAFKTVLNFQSEHTGQQPWTLSAYPHGRDFAFTIIHDADDAYSKRLALLFDTFDELGLKVTTTSFCTSRQRPL